MRLIRSIAWALLAIIALLLVIAAFVSGDIQFEKSITIQAPAEKIWPYVSTLKGLDSWSPWADKDPAMKQTNSGADGTVGARQCWESKMKEVGKGCQTLAVINPLSLVETDLKFYTPYESDAKAKIVLVPDGNGTKVTWGFTSSMPYPFRIFKLFMNLDQAMDADFTLGLNRLKKLAEMP